MPLSEALNSLKKGIENLATLHVRTFTGNLETVISEGQGLDDLHDLLSQASVDGKVTLVADTRVGPDFDTDIFTVNTAAEGVPDRALKLHQDALKAASESRQALVELFKDLLLEA